MLGGMYETGWAELKAEPVSVFGEVKFRIEPSQHQWFRLHHEHIPCMFIVSTGNEIFVIDGRYHLSLAEKVKLTTLEQFASFRSNKHDFVRLAAFLRQATRRDRGDK